MHLVMFSMLALLTACKSDPEDTSKPAPTDSDRDGYAAEEDCDDKAASVHPDASEKCNGIDDDCDGTVDNDPVDEHIFYADGDGDGYGSATVPGVGCEAPAGFVDDRSDCDDTRADIHPGAEETDCTDPTDYNCDGSTLEADLDGDGYAACEDCNDLAFDVHTDAPETCNNRDDDCDSTIDEDAIDLRTWHPDSDRDGYGSSDTALQACNAPSGYVSDGRDCDDGNYDRNPGQIEICDDANTDEDCNGVSDDDDIDVDSASLTSWYTDSDNDGYGDATSGRALCEAPPRTISVGGDCNDQDITISPAAQEICDTGNVDEDCDGRSDDADTSVDRGTMGAWYRDSDSDGYGSTTVILTRCDGPAGYINTSGDCNDSNISINPAGTEVCDSANADEDCDGGADDADPNLPDSAKTAFTTDGDGDGYGVTGTEIYACDTGNGAAAFNGDCDDNNTHINPGMPEICDASDTDENCNGTADNADATVTGRLTWYTDADHDNYGGTSSGLTTCDAPANTISTGGDCNDADVAINPAALERCDASNVDEDCDGLADDNDTSPSGTTPFYQDSDNDGYGNSATQSYRCDAGSGRVANGSDCDDTNLSISPGNAEVCDSIDNDCDGLTDDADPVVSGAPSWYVDSDGDGFGADNTVVHACIQPGNTTASGNDCDESNTAINPSATETCGNGVDEDCSDRIDDCGLVGTRNLSTAEVRLLGASASALTGTSVYAGINEVLVGAPGLSNGTVYQAALSYGNINLSSQPTWNGASTSASAGTAALWMDNNGVSTYIFGASGLNGFYMNTHDAPSTYSTGSLITGSTASNIGYDFAAGDIGSSTALLVGAPSGAGAAYLLTTDFSSIEGAADVIYTGSSGTDLAGASVGLVDLDGDGVDDMVVGSTGAYSFGAVGVVLAPSSGTYSINSADIIIAGAAINSAFGSVVADAGDADNDGYNDLAVGALNTKKVYLFTGNVTGSFGASDAIATFNGPNSSEFGYAIASGDFDGDGAMDLAIGAPQDDAANGRVYIYSGPNAGTLATTNASGILTGSGRAGASLSSNDIDLDGLDDLLIGGPTSTGSVAGSGAAWLLYGAP